MGDWAAGEGPSGNKNPLLLPAGPCLALSLLTDQTRDSSAFRVEVVVHSGWKWPGPRSEVRAVRGRGGRLLRRAGEASRRDPLGPVSWVAGGPAEPSAGETRPGFLQQRGGAPCLVGPRESAERAQPWVASAKEGPLCTPTDRLRKGAMIMKQAKNAAGSGKGSLCPGGDSTQSWCGVAPGPLRAATLQVTPTLGWASNQENMHRWWASLL